MESRGSGEDSSSLAVTHTNYGVDDDENVKQIIFEVRAAGMSVTAAPLAVQELDY